MLSAIYDWVATLSNLFLVLCVLSFGLRQAPGQVTGLLRRGLLYAGLLTILVGEMMVVVAEAITEYQATVRLAPDYLRPYNNLRSALYRTGRLKEAEGIYRQVVRLNTRDDDAYWYLGMVLQKKGAVAPAIEAYQETAQRNPQHVAALSNLGCLLLQGKRFGPALAALQAATQIAPNAETQLNLGAALYGMGRRGEARATRKNILTLPDAAVSNGDTTPSPASLARKLLKQNPA